MNTGNGTVAEYIALQSRTQIAANALLSFVFSLLGGIGISAAIFITPPPSTSNLYGAIWGVIISFVTMALLRNFFLRFVLARISRSSLLSLLYNGRKIGYLLLILGVSSFIIGLATNVRLADFGFGTMSIFISLYLIFSGPLTYEGEMKILFGLLTVNLNNFVTRQEYLKTVSRKVENQLKSGNIKVPHNDLVYYFNMKLLKGIDVTNDLENIETWILDKRTPCFKSLKKIYPEKKFEPCTKGTFSQRFLENPPPLLKYVFSSVALVILSGLSPEIVKEVLDFFSKLH